MLRWKGKVAVVTGASAGIGRATVRALAEQGMTVVGLARRKTQMEENMKDFKGPGKFFPKECDITKKDDVVESLNWVKSNLGSVDVLVNNAGVIKHETVTDSSTEDIEQIFNVNVLGLMYCTKQFIDIFQKDEVKRESHIINVNSVLGHVQLPGFSCSVYPASKFAVRAFSDTLRTELKRSKIKVTNLSPGLVKTDMRETAVKKFSGLKSEPALNPQDLAEAIVYVLGSPPHVEINELMIKAKHT